MTVMSTGISGESPGPASRRAPHATAFAIGAIVATIAARWRRRVERHAWLVLEPFLPGATLFLLLVVLVAGYLRHGFATVRQHALAPDGGKWALTAPARRRWWSCPCASLRECRCLQRLAGAGTRWFRALCTACTAA
ncbi:MAG: hypothetical protein U1F10_14260 [Burkholderiales bacterium]